MSKLKRTIVLASLLILFGTSSFADMRIQTPVYKDRNLVTTMPSGCELVTQRNYDALCAAGTFNEAEFYVIVDTESWKYGKWAAEHNVRKSDFFADPKLEIDTMFDAAGTLLSLAVANIRPSNPWGYSRCVAQILPVTNPPYPYQAKLSCFSLDEKYERVHSTFVLFAARSSATAKKITSKLDKSVVFK